MPLRSSYRVFRPGWGMTVIATALICVAAAAATSRADVWQPSKGHTQIPLWPGAAPDMSPSTTAESMHTDAGNMIGGKRYYGVRDVSRPTMTIYSPTVANTGAAIVVYPGGGYRALAIDLEGTELCDWLVAKGITCVVLKYRVPDSGPHYYADCKCQRFPKAPWALQDAQRAMGLLRAHAAEYKLDPHKLGAMGFSAGGHLVAWISNAKERAYKRIDAADDQPSQPDFAIVAYPGHLWIDEAKFELHDHIRVTARTPPTFIVQATDDDVDDVNHSLVYYRALVAAKVPVEMHLFAHGGHAFGLRKPTEPVGAWPQLVDSWLASIGMTQSTSSAKKAK